MSYYNSLLYELNRHTIKGRTSLYTFIEKKTHFQLRNTEENAEQIECKGEIDLFLRAFVH